MDISSACENGFEDPAQLGRRVGGQRLGAPGDVVVGAHEQDAASRISRAARPVAGMILDARRGPITWVRIGEPSSAADRLRPPRPMPRRRCRSKA